MVIEKQCLPNFMSTFAMTLLTNNLLIRQFFTFTRGYGLANITDFHLSMSQETRSGAYLGECIYMYS